MKALDNLVKINQLKVEPFDANEFAGMVRAGDNKLKDAAITELSEDSQFMLAYGAAHSFSLAALRWHGQILGMAQYLQGESPPELSIHPP